MIAKNSGKLFLIPLEFNLGFTIGKLMDFTDYSTFNGNIIYVYDFFCLSTLDIPTTEKIENLEILFGPMCINKKPNERGRNSWKLLGKLDIGVEKTSPPVFKRTDFLGQILNIYDWSKIKGWKLHYEFNISGEAEYEFEKVRAIEVDYLYEKREIEIRATMHFLFLMKKNIAEYYDLSIERLKFIYLPMANTSFKKNETLKLIKAVPIDSREYLSRGSHPIKGL